MSESNNKTPHDTAQGPELVENLVKLTLAPNVGCVSVNRLLNHFGNSDAILGASESQLREVEGLRKNQQEGVLKASGIDPRPEMELAAERGVKILCYDAPNYPKQLKEMAHDPPFMLYVRGELKPYDAFNVAIVGTRRCSHYGREQAERFGSLLARAGYTVTSGLARGVDSAAHKGALNARGRTLAIVGCGMMHMYPPENRDLANEIAGQGAVISEFAMQSKPTRESFPRRNRIIAGISMGTLIVEAPEKSGAMITANMAANINREVFAIPGRIDQHNASGCLALIRDGAKLVRNLEDILEELPRPDFTPEDAANESDEEVSPQPRVPTEIGDIGDSNTNQVIVKALGSDQKHFDHICDECNLPASSVSPALMMLELSRTVRKHPGNFYTLINN